jgi:tRNA(Ile)-lysidine synthase
MRCVLRSTHCAGGAADDPLISALAAAVPAGFWAMPAVVAVSGGADSVGLLLGLLAIAPVEARHRLVVAHAEHDLRAAAADDRAFVERLAADMGLEVECRRLFVRDAEDQGEGIEAVARRLRYGFLEDVARVRGARHVVVGHTADDQAETVLHRVLRGTGLHGLAGMRAARELVSGVSLLRPLLGVRRIVVRDFLARVGQAWCEDESNLDRDYARNFLRHEILARCEAGPYPDASAATARLAAQAATASAAIRSAADFILGSRTSRHADGSVVMRTQGLTAVDPHLAAELFAALWQREGWPQRDMTARHYASLATLLRDDSPPAIDLPGGIHARRASDDFMILRRAAERSL